MAGSERHGKTGITNWTQILSQWYKWYGFYLTIKLLLHQIYITGISTDSGLAFSESKSINLSLSTLGKVIQCLSSDKPAHIPYRESKLTRILQV